MTEKPLVSIMIPTYNQEEYISEAIDSSLNQTYDNLEVVVSDDCSTDDTWKIIQSYDDPRLRTYRNRSNLGKSGNYQRLLYDLAGGDLAINLDGDDYYTDQEFIEIAVNRFFLEYDDCVLVWAKSKTIQGNFEWFSYPREEGLEDGQRLFLRKIRKGQYTFFHLSCLYDRPLAMELDFYRQDFPAEDSLGLMKLILHGKVGTIDKTVGAWRLHNDNITSKTNKIDYLPLIDESINHAQKWSDIDRKLLERYRKEGAKQLSIRGISQAIRSRRWKKANDILRESLEEDRLTFRQLVFSPRIYVSLLPKKIYGYARKIYRKIKSIWISTTR